MYENIDFDNIDLTQNPPQEEPDRQYYYIAKARPVSYTHLDVYKRQLQWFGGTGRKEIFKVVRCVSKIDGRSGFRISGNHAKYQPRKE